MHRSIGRYRRSKHRKSMTSLTRHVIYCMLISGSEQRIVCAKEIGVWFTVLQLVGRRQKHVEVLVRFSVWSDLFVYGPVDATAYPNPIISCVIKSRLVLPLWYRLTQVVLVKRPLNGCSSSFRVRVTCRSRVPTSSFNDATDCLCSERR